MSGNRRLIYTASVGNSIQLPVLEFEEGLEYWALLGGKAAEAQDESGKWKFLRVNGLVQPGSRQAQLQHRECKILADQSFDEFDSILYIDPTVEILLRPSALIEEFEKRGENICFVGHSFRKNLREEYKEVFRLGLDYAVTIFDHYHSLNETRDLGKMPINWGGMFWTNNSLVAQEFRKRWFGFVQSGSARDQLSLPLALEGFEHGVITLDNNSSFYHKWPNRKNQTRIWNRRYGFSSLAKPRFALSYLLRNLTVNLLFSNLIGRNQFLRRFSRWVLIKMSLHDVWN